ncbi:MAG: carboxypeptidase-like regulatory domain-containing protein [Planctomycetota bacterium]
MTLRVVVVGIVVAALAGGAWFFVGVGADRADKTAGETRAADYSDASDESEKRPRGRRSLRGNRGGNRARDVRPASATSDMSGTASSAARDEASADGSPGDDPQGAAPAEAGSASQAAGGRRSSRSGRRAASSTGRGGSAALSTDVDAQANAKGTLVVKVVAADTTYPVRGALVQVLSRSRIPKVGARPMSQGTDARGLAYFELPIGRYTASVATGQGRSEEVLADAESEVRIEVAGGALRRGRVVTYSGASVPGASVWLSFGDSPSAGGGIAVETSPNGTFELPNVLTTQWVGAQKDGFVPTRLQRVGDKAEILLQLSPASFASTVTVGSATGPVAGAEVLAYPVEIDTPELALHELPPAPVRRYTDEKGEAHFHMAPEADGVRYAAHALGYFGSTQKPDDESVQLTLHEQFYTYVTVVDGAGNPMTQVSVAVLRPTQVTNEYWLDMPQRSGTNKSGRRTVAMMAGCRLLLISYKTGATLVTAPIASGQRLTLTLEGRGTIHYALANQDGQKIPDWRIVQDFPIPDGVIHVASVSDNHGGFRAFLGAADAESGPGGIFGAPASLAPFGWPLDPVEELVRTSRQRYDMPPPQ